MAIVSFPSARGMVLLAVVFSAAAVFSSVSKAQDCEVQSFELSGPLESSLSDTAWYPAREDFVPSWHAMVTNIPRDVARSVGTTFSTSSIPTVVGLSAVTVVFLVSDRKTYEASKAIRRSSPFAESATRMFVSLGDGRSQLLLAGAMASYGLVASDRRALRTASQTVEALLASGVTVQVLKHMTGRESPVAASSHRGQWRPFTNLKEYHRNQTRYYAFPSGHITTAMATVTVVAENYPEQKWIRPLGYTVVGLIGVGLVSKGYHWYSDLPLGVAIGHMFGKIVSRPGEADVVGKDSGVPTTFTVTPVAIPSGGAISLALLF